MRVLLSKARGTWFGSFSCKSDVDRLILPPQLCHGDDVLLLLHHMPDGDNCRPSRQQTLDKMSSTKSTGRTPKLDKLNPIQLIRILLSQSLITMDKLNSIQLIRILLSQSLITMDKLNAIQLIRILLSQSLITLDKLNPIQLIRILLYRV
uniref:Uncharacterized protein n=1 Tax=Globodera pallida TaxID=36090 RepID=A0A183CI47_GLOPA